MSIYEPQICQVYWGTHGCALPRHHEGNHKCVDDESGDICEEVDRQGWDGGFQWGLYGADTECRVYWGHSGCARPRGHVGDHLSESGSSPEMGLMFGEDTTEEERADLGW